MPSTNSPFIRSTGPRASVTPPSGFSGLYYPYADVRNPSLFLLSCLLFDHVYVLAPRGYGSREHKYREFSLLQSGRQSIGGRSAEEVDPLLVEHDIVRPISTDAQAMEHKDLILANIRSDLAASNPFLDDRREKYLWELYFCNPPFCSEFYELCEFASGISKPKYYTSWQQASMLPTHMEREEKIKKPDDPKEELDDPVFDRGTDWDGGFVIERRYQGDVRVKIHRSDIECVHRIIVPFTIGESLMISHALIACAAYGLVPFTDNSLHHEFLCKKIQRCLTQDEAGTVLNNYFPHGAKVTALTKEVIQQTLIPIEGLTALDVIRLREECRDSLIRFRVSMNALATKMKSEFWAEQFEREVQDLVRSEVIPSLVALRDQFTAIKEKLIVGSIKSVLFASPLSMITTAFIGIPLAASLIASAGAGLGTTILDYYSERRKLNRNDLSLLLTLEKESTR